MLRASLEHAAALHKAIREVHEVEIPAGRVEAAGCTDLQIARSILELAGVDPDRVDARSGALGEATARHYDRLVPDDLSAFVAPGVPGVLEELSARDDLILSLVTGNLEPVARAKLRAAGLGRFFAPGQGGFGSDAEDRAQLPRVARERAGRPGAAYPRERTVVIGDTPRDIACARADGVRVIGIATGPFAARELAAADSVVEHATDLPAAIAALSVSR
jgi:phosphoglycolate phosphatase